MASVFDEAKKFASRLTAIPGRQACFLDVPGTGSAAQLSVVSFTCTEEMGEPNTLRVVLTHPQQLPRADYLNRDAAFRIVPDDGRPKKYSGYIERFSTIQTTKDFVKYEVVLKSHLGRLAAVTNSQIYQHQSTPEILEAVMRRHALRPEQYSFRLRKQYPKHLFRFQYRMTDLAYVQMMMQRSGIYCYTVETEYGDQIVFGDDIDHYLYDPRLIVPYREAAGLEAGGKEAVTSLQTHTVTVPQSFTVADYNPESAWERFRDEANIAPQDPTTYGQPYIYGTHHLDQEGAKWEAQLRHEAAIARQVVYEGNSNVLELRCARVLEMDALLPDALTGQVIIKITHSGARDKPYTNEYEAIPADRRFRLELKPQTWAKIAGTLSARITSPDRYKYAYLTACGHYPVRFDIDFADWPKGGESVPLRLAKPFAGKLQTGMHFVALDNDEAVISFRDGDPDKPEITAFHHHSQARDLVTNDRRWLSRNMIRTQSNNKLRMEDWEGQEGIKLSTEHSGKSQLNLGYLVDGKLERRGEGFELRSSGQGAIRAKGVLITAEDQPGAGGQQLDTEGARRLLQEALQLSESLAETAAAAQAVAADYERQKALLDVLVNQIHRAGVLVSAPGGLGMVSGSDLQLTAGKNIIATAGGHADVNILKRFTVAAGELVSVFAQKLGIKLIANRGKVEIQAQSDEMGLVSDKDMTITSANGRVVIEAKQELLLKCGGSYLRMSSTGIEDGTRGDRIIRSAAFSRQGPSSLSQHLNSLPKVAFNDPYVLRNKITGDVLKHQPYEIVREDGSRIKGVTDELGRTAVQKSHDLESIMIRVLRQNKGESP